MKKDILYQYTIRTDGQSIELIERGGGKIPIAKAYDSTDLTCAGILRDLAKWAIEQAEIIEEMVGFRDIPDRKPFARYKAEIIEDSGDLDTV